MNILILNRDYALPPDGWYQIAPFGEFPHQGAGIVQVIDREAGDAMVARFAADAKVQNFAGLLVDFDHFSLDGEKKSEAAGWLLGLECRNSGLFAQIRWSDVGEEAVKGGRYRFLSPVWARSDCVDLGNGRFRPVRMLNAAVTNDPNLKGMMPLSNRSQESEDKIQKGDPAANRRGDPLDFLPVVEGVEGKAEVRNGRTAMKSVIERLVNHLGLAADATETVILEKMAGLPSLTAVTDLQNSLRDLQGKHDGVVANLKKVEGELVNRHLEDFEGVVSDGSKAFWAEQLVQNREGALAALGDLVKFRDAAGKGDTGGGDATPTRKPLHNRATARPVPPGQGDRGGDGESKAVKIRNRAHEIAKAEGVPFAVAFRRAEKEIAGV